MSTLRVDAITNQAGTTQPDIDGVAKAWVNFNGTGTVAINESFNVSSITDNATGDYTINFSTSIVDTNYAAAGSSDGYGGGAGVVFGPPATGSIGMKVFDQSGTLRDHDKVFAIFVR